VTDYAALIGTMWPDDGYSTRMYDPTDPHGYREHLARITRFRVPPFPAIDLFPRWTCVERFIAEWRERITGAWYVLRHGEPDRW